MSLILDALNKADNERKKQQEDLPGIATPHDSFLPRQSKTKQKKIWLLAGVAIFVLLLAIVYFLGRSSSNTESSSPPSTISKQSKGESSSKVIADKKAPSQKKEPQSIKNAPVKEKIAALAAAKTSKASAKNDTASVDNATKKQIAAQYAKAESTKEKAPAKKKQIGNLYQSTTTPKAKPAVAKSRPKTSEPKITLDSFPNIGTVRELTYSAQQKIPTLMYTEHNYTSNGSSTITMNGKKVRSGGSVAPGVRVDAILSDGVILRYQNKKFKMPAYNSWVNM